MKTLLWVCMIFVLCAQAAKNKEFAYDTQEEVKQALIAIKEIRDDLCQD